MNKTRTLWLRERARLLYDQHNYAQYNIPFKKVFKQVKRVWTKEKRVGLELGRG